MKNKWYVPVMIFAVLVLVYFVRGIIDDRAEYEVLRTGTMEDMVSSKAVIIKYETLYETGADGTVEAKVVSGAKVSKGELLANIYNGKVDTEVMAKLDRVNKKIETVKASQEEGASFSSDITKLDSEISSKVNDIIQNAQKKNMGRVSELKTTLATLAERRAEVSGQKGAAQGTLKALEQTKENLLARIGVAHKELRSKSAGVFISHSDGLEHLITPYNMDALTPEKVNELQETDRNNRASSQKNDNVFACKIVDNFRYFAAVNISADRAVNLKPGKSVSLRFNELSTDIIDAQIYSVSAEQDGFVTVICECSKYLNDLLEKRVVSVDFILNRHEGYRVSVPAIHTQDGVVGVFVKRDSVMRFIPVNILYNTQDVAIVSSADNQKPLKLYDEVVVEALKYEEGAFIN